MSKKKKILLVDDEESLLLAFKALLIDEGFDVKSETDVDSASEAFTKAPHSFDLFITDMNMPKKNGCTLFQEFLQVRDDIPVILLTGYSDKIDRESAFKKGAIGYFQKPVDIDEFLKFVHNLLKIELKSLDSLREILKAQRLITRMSSVPFTWNSIKKNKGSVRFTHLHEASSFTRILVLFVGPRLLGQENKYKRSRTYRPRPKTPPKSARYPLIF